MPLFSPAFVAHHEPWAHQRPFCVNACGGVGGRSPDAGTGTVVLNPGRAPKGPTSSSSHAPGAAFVVAGAILSAGCSNVASSRRLLRTRSLRPGRGVRWVTSRGVATLDAPAAAPAVAPRTLIDPATPWTDEEYPGCPGQLDLPAPIEPDPNSTQSRKRMAKFQAIKEKLQEQKEKKKAERELMRQNEPEPEDPIAEQERIEKWRKWSADLREKEHAEFVARLDGAPTVCVDCEWESAMSRKQLRSVVNTLLRLYSSNRVAERPCRLLFSGVQSGSRTKELLEGVSGFPNWPRRMTISEQPYIRLFEPSRLVYLSPDGEEAADAFDDPDMVYIVGGLNDHNNLTGRSRKKCELQGIRSIRLPIPERVERTGIDTIMTANQVFDMILARRTGLSWEDVFLKHMPSRKLRKHQDRFNF